MTKQERNEKEKTMRLIDAEKLKWDFKVYIPSGVPQNFVDTICNMVDAQPTIEAEPKHGRWVWKKPSDDCRCSNCGKIVDRRYPYCPNCGAKMEWGK